MHRFPTPPDRVYQYTSLESLLKILQSRRLRFTDFRYLNDWTEFRHIVPTLQELSAEAVASSDATSSAAHGMYYRHLELLLNRVDFVGVACFSGTSDDLGQWRAYTPPGAGVAIVFDGPRLNELARSGSHCHTLHACIYVTSEIEFWPRNVHAQGEYAIYAAELDAPTFFCNAAVYKDPAFVAEKEWRLVSRPFDRRGLPQAMSLETGDALLFRVGSYSLMPYMDISFGGTGTSVATVQDSVLSAIVGIEVGPTREPDLSKRAVESALWRYGLRLPDGAVTNSRIPFRKL